MNYLDIALIVLALVGIWAVIEVALTVRGARKSIDEVASTANEVIAQTQPIVAKLATAFSEIARSPEVRTKLFQQGWQVVGTSPEGLANRIKRDTNMLGGVIAMRGIKVE